MNRVHAWQYILASSPSSDPDDIDLRVAAFLGAMHQAGKLYEEIDWNDFWAGRCQLGALAGGDFQAVRFCVAEEFDRTSKDVRHANAKEFCDRAHWPTKEVVYGALRRLAILRMAGDEPPQATGHEKWIWTEVSVPSMGQFLKHACVACRRSPRRTR